MNTTILAPEWVLFNAFRYALGRRSYVVGETVEQIRHQLVVLEEDTINLMIRDIGEFLRKPYPNEERYVYQPWAELRDDLRRELDRRQA